MVLADKAHVLIAIRSITITINAQTECSRAALQM